MRVRDLQLDRADRDEFPLSPFIRAVELSPFQDHVAMDAWMRQHLLADLSADWLLLLNYIGPLTQH